MTRGDLDLASQGMGKEDRQWLGGVYDALQAAGGPTDWSRFSLAEIRGRRAVLQAGLRCALRVVPAEAGRAIVAAATEELRKALRAHDAVIKKAVAAQAKKR